MMEHIGPIEARLIPGKGRGVVATRDIKQGEFVLVQRALVNSDDVTMAQSDLNDMCRMFKLPNNSPQIRLVHNMIKKMRLDKTVASKVLALVSNQEESDKRVPFSSLEQMSMDANEPLEGCGDCAFHPEEAYAIMARNKYFRESNLATIKHHLQIKGPSHDSALFHTLALFNHSCMNNCTNQVIGDFCLVMANQDIPKDEELSISYIDSSLPLAVRKQLFGNFDFMCACELCVK